MRSYKERRIKYYNEVMRLWYDETLSVARISKITSVPTTTIERWITKFAAENGISRSHNANKVMAKTEKKIEQLNLESEIKRLKAENARLESDLRRAEMKADLYNEMIDVAEKTFDIPIRKKAGAKR